MENQISSMSPEDSIRIISEMISKTKKEFHQNSFFFLLWGYLISFACIAQFTLLKLMYIETIHTNIGILSAIVWFFTVTAGVVSQFAYIAKKGKTVRVKTYIDEFMAIHWQVNGALIILAGFFCWRYNIHPSPFILAICGAATLVTGLILKHRSLISGSIFLLIFSVLTLWIDNEYQLLLTAAAIILGYILPGYSLKNLNK